ncbi:hypothetical protein N0V86_008869 [Didymella sp. IMI 355093]|nr:hypothetical protein N0V86_008869 [Didymella sp. IMI 355093]
MSHLQYFSYKGAFAERSKKEISYSQDVRIKSRIEILEQGGWDRFTEEIPEPISDEVNQAFDNVEYAIQLARGKMNQA